MNTNKEMPTIKTEPSDCYSEHIDLEMQSLEVDLGREFKAELSPDEVNTEVNTVSNPTYKLIYCASCDVTWDYSKRESNCFTCNSILTCKCGRCMKIFASIKSLDSHLYRYCNERTKFRCQYCRFKSFHKSNLDLHVEQKHSSSQPSTKLCPTCGKSFSLRTNLKRHLDLCGRSEEFKRTMMFYSCAECDYRTDRKTTISEHIQSKHLPHDFCHKCDRCGKGFMQPRYLQKHLKICGLSKENRDLVRMLHCDDCEYKTDKKQHLRDHIHMKHLPADPNLNRCNRCGKKFSHRNGLLRHLKSCGIEIVQDEFKKFSCGQCDYKASRKDHLTRHNERLHCEILKCNKCKRVFRGEKKLSQHAKRGCKTRVLPTLVPQRIMKLN